MLALVALIVISLCIAIFFLILFIRAVRKDQFKDTYTPSVRMLFDDTETNNNSNS